MKNSISILNEHVQKKNYDVDYIFGSTLDSYDNFIFKCECLIFQNDIDSLTTFGESYNSKKDAKENSAEKMLEKLGIDYQTNHNLTKDLKTLDIDVTPIDINQLNKHYIKKLEEINTAYQKIKDNL